MILGLIFSIELSLALVEHDQKKTKQQLQQVLERFLKKSHPNRVPGSKGHRGAFEFLKKEIQSFHSTSKLQIEQRTFAPDTQTAVDMYLNDYRSKVLPNFQPGHPEHTKWTLLTNSVVETLRIFGRVQGRNLWVRKSSSVKDAKTIVLMANYDTIGTDPNTHIVLADGMLPGADANASGAIMALELLRLLATRELNYHLEVVFLDYGELGYLGARHFLRNRKASEFEMAVNLMMLGHDTQRYDTEKKFGNMKLYYRQENASELGWAEKFRKKSKELSVQMYGQGLDNGDHVVFWEKNIPTLVFSQNWETDFNLKGHHSSNDVLQTLNMKTYSELYNHLADLALKLWAKTPKK